MNKFILLNALNRQDFVIDTDEEMVESIKEFGCDVLMSHDVAGQTTYYAVAKTKEALINMCETVEMPGIVLEYTAVYDQAEIVS